MKSTLFIYRLVYFSAVLSTFILASCSTGTSNPDPPGILPQVTTASISSVTNNSAFTGGTVVSEGSSAVSARGVCYSTSANPTISSSIVVSGGGSGNFSVTLAGLSVNTTYYARAYATNASGTAYGNQLTFTTTNTPPPAPVDTAQLLFIGGWHTLYAFNAQSGVLKWSKNLGNYVMSSPAYYNGKVYVGCQDGKLYCYDTTGNFKWSYTSSYSIGSQSPVIDNGKVYIANEQGRIYALDAETGSQVWQHISPYSSLSGLVIKNNILYYHANYMYALNASTGSLLWSYYTNGQLTPLIHNNKLYAINGSSTAVMYVLNAQTGSLLWQVSSWDNLNAAVSLNLNYGRLYVARQYKGYSVLDTTSGNHVYSVLNNLYVNTQLTYGHGVAPILTDSIAYLPASTGVYAYNALTGGFLWKAYADDIVSGATVLNKTLFYGSRQTSFGNGHVYAVDAQTGNTKWVSIVSDDFNVSSPCIVTKSGKMHRYGLIFN